MKKTILEIDLNALEHNFNVISSKLKPTTKFMAVVKAFSYGSDSKIISDELKKNGVDYLAVAYVKEGVELRNSGIDLPILVLHPQEDDFNEIIKFSLEPSIYSFRILNLFFNALNISSFLSGDLTEPFTV